MDRLTRTADMIGGLVLFGASGDLAGRFILPALAALYETDQLPGKFVVVGAARQNWNDETFQVHAEKRLNQHAPGVSADARKQLVRALRYRQVDVTNPESVARVVHADVIAGEPVAAYLALPPGVLPAVITALGAASLRAGSRIVVEKPFGDGFDSAVALNTLLAKVCGDAGEQAVFRVDHVLGMATVQNLVGLRFANRIIEPLWNSDHIEQIDILWEETLALEGRASFYDRAGAVKDVMQNHMMQVLSLIAMEPPASLSATDLRNSKVDVLRYVVPLSPEDVRLQTRRARYTAGRLAGSNRRLGRAVPDYVQEKGVDPARRTETFAEIILDIDNPRWVGTRFVLRAGKAFARRHKGVIARFRNVPPSMFLHQKVHPIPNELRIGLDGPEDITLNLCGSVAETPPSLVPVPLTGPPPISRLPAYSRVLLDILTGQSTLSVRGDEAEEAWRVLEPVLQAWACDRVPLEEYRAGSDGPPRIDYDRSRRREAA
jgi:glucose-6-phosphate 1-dehydrogenase